MENSVNGFWKCDIMPLSRNIFQNNDFSINGKLETSLEIENVSQENGPINDIVKRRTEFEPIGKKLKPKFGIFQNIYIKTNEIYPR